MVPFLVRCSLCSENGSDLPALGRYPKIVAVYISPRKQPLFKISLVSIHLPPNRMQITHKDVSQILIGNILCRIAQPISSRGPYLGRSLQRGSEVTAEPIQLQRMGGGGGANTIARCGSIPALGLSLNGTRAVLYVPSGGTFNVEVRYPNDLASIIGLFPENLNFNTTLFKLKLPK